MGLAKAKTEVESSSPASPTNHKAMFNWTLTLSLSLLIISLTAPKPTLGLADSDTDSDPRVQAKAKTMQRPGPTSIPASEDSFIREAAEDAEAEERRRLEDLSVHQPSDYDEYYYSNESYDYNVTDSSPTLEEALPIILSYSLTFVIGIIGNSLVMFSIAYYRRMRTTTNVFLFSLASADLLLILLCVPVKVSRELESHVKLCC